MKHYTKLCVLICVTILFCVTAHGDLNICPRMPIATAVIHNWVSAINAAGQTTLSQPACGDLSNGVASCSTDTTNASNISSGILAIAEGGTGLATTSQNFIFAGPSSGSGAPSWRLMVAGDVPTLNQNTTGTAGNGYTTPTTGSNFLGATASGSLTGVDVTAHGVGAGTADTSGHDNTFIGFDAGITVTTGSSNTVVGSQVGPTSVITTGARNTIVGATITPAATNVTDTVYVGSGAGTSAIGNAGDVVLGSLAQGGASNQTANTTLAVVSIGYSANGNSSYSAADAVTVGAFSSAGGADDIILGAGVQSNSADTFVAGHGGNTSSTNYITTTAANQITFGTSTKALKDMFLGNGAAGIAAPSNITIQPTPVLTGTTNTAGASFTILGGNSTGTGVGGSIVFKTAAAGSTGSTVNTLTQAASIDSTGALNLGVNATSTGLLNLATSVGSGANITVKNGGATTAYNFNLPITVGGAGTVLTSQGGGSTAMTWTTPLTNPMNTAGQMLYGGSSGTITAMSAGNSGQVPTVQSGGTSVALGNIANFRNHLVNAGLDYWQAGTSGTVTATGGGTPTATYLYQADQWYVNNILGGGTIEGIITYSQVAFSNYGAAFGLSAKITTAPTGTGIQNGLELYQTLSNKSTQAFLANQSASFTVLIKAAGNVNQAGIQLFYNSSEAKVNTAIGSEVLTSISSAGFTTATISGQSLTGVIASLQTGSLGVRIRPTAVSTGNLYDLNNGIIIELPMLNVGLAPMPFARQFEDPAAEFASCQYFYEKSYNITTAPGTSSTTVGAPVYTSSGANGPYSWTFKVTKRATPSMTGYSTSTGTSGDWRNVNTSADVAVTFSRIGLSGFGASTAAASGNVVEGQWVADARL